MPADVNIETEVQWIGPGSTDGTKMCLADMDRAITSPTQESRKGFGVYGPFDTGAGLKPLTFHRGKSRSS